MKVNWEEVPWWINYITPSCDSYNKDLSRAKNAIGWSTKPYLTTEKYNYLGSCKEVKSWGNFYDTEDDGYTCEIPYNTAEVEQWDLDNFEAAIYERP